MIFIEKSRKRIFYHSQCEQIKSIYISLWSCANDYDCKNRAINAKRCR